MLNIAHLFIFYFSIDEWTNLGIHKYYMYSKSVNRSTWFRKWNWSCVVGKLIISFFIIIIKMTFNDEVWRKGLRLTTLEKLVNAVFNANASQHANSFCEGILIDCSAPIAKTGKSSVDWPINYIFSLWANCNEM